MSSVPPIGTPAYDTIEYVMNGARVRVLDAIDGISGDILADSQPYSGTYLNTAWRKFQIMLANSGCETFVNEATFLSLPVVATTDPAIECILNWSGFYDGNTWWGAYQLPSDMIMPLTMWERLASTKTPLGMMTPAGDGLPRRPKFAWLSDWEWRTNGIYLVGATTSRDLVLRYAKLLPDLPAPGTSGAPTTQIPFIWAGNPMADLVAAEYCNGRDSAKQAYFVQSAQNGINQIIALTTRRKQRINYRRRPYGHAMYRF